MQQANDLEERLYRFALGVLKFCGTLGRSHEADAVHRQLPRAAAAAVSHYRAARRGRSRREFVAVIGKSVEEMDESGLWLKLSVDSGFGHPERAAPLLQEANELLRILARSYATARANLERQVLAQRRRRQIATSPDRHITK